MIRAALARVARTRAGRNDVTLINSNYIQFFPSKGGEITFKQVEYKCYVHVRTLAPGRVLLAS